MSAATTLKKMIKALLKTHPNPTAPIQDLYNNSTDKREKEEIAVLDYG
jgi:uridine kinase